MLLRTKVKRPTKEDHDSWLRDLVEDLAQRKIDTIVAAGITGRAMPDPVTALLDIHNTYFRALIKFGVVDLSVPAEWHGIVDDRGWLLANDAARRWLIARALDGFSRPSVKAPEACVLQRIVSTCKSLESIVPQIEPYAPGPGTKVVAGDSIWPGKRAGTDLASASRGYQREGTARPDVKLTRQDRSALSKAWELGADTVALQTIVMLDGDIITRIGEQYTGTSHAVVREIHQKAVETSLSTWAGLANGVVSFFQGLIRPAD